MAFTEANRVQIRQYTGASAVWAGIWPALENAITASQSTADGGTRSDSSTEALILDYLTRLAAIDTAILDALCDVSAVKVDEIQVDAVRGVAMLRVVGRQYVGRLCSALGMSRGPLSDCFSSLPVNPSGMMGSGLDPFL